MKIALAADHAGFPLKEHLARFLTAQGYEVLDLGVDSSETRTDYPDTAEVAGHAVLEGRAERAIVVCGSGVGVCIAANKLPGIYAGLCHDTYSAHQGVEHDRMNVLCLGAKIVGEAVAEEIVQSFLNARPMSEERYLRRFQKVQAMERRIQG